MPDEIQAIPEFESFSQAGQDRFVYELLVKPHLKIHGAAPIGNFLDIGCNHPVELSNSLALERMGWGGFLFDNDAHCIRLCMEQRRSPVINADVTKYDWASLPTKHFDYLSLDVDAASLPTLAAVLEAGITFRVATIEHDSYRFGKGPCLDMRTMLGRAGYIAFAHDVCYQAHPYEDWWTHPSLWKDPKTETGKTKWAFDANGIEGSEIVDRFAKNQDT